MNSASSSGEIEYECSSSGKLRDADVGGVRADALDHLLAHLGVAADEPGLVALVDAEQVVEDENLAVGRRARRRSR